MTLTKSELLILKAMHQTHSPMSINEISEKSLISWVVVKKYLPRLQKKGYIEVIQDGERNYYKFNYDRIS